MTTVGPTSLASNSSLSTLASLAGGRGVAGRVDERAGVDFASVLGTATAARGATNEARARDAAEQFVAAALVQPVLKQLRQSNMGAPPFVPTQGEQQFQGLMDAAVAQQIVHAKHFPLVDSIQQSILKQASTAGDKGGERQIRKEATR